MHPDECPPIEPRARRVLVVLYAAICLDAVGVGLVFPILPRLLADVTPGADPAPALGWMAALYAAMQFACAPALGALSDALGRRPVMIVSLLGAAVNYAAMAAAPTLALLLLGRALGGATSANVSVATAYLTDLSDPEERPRRFGLSNAMFGVGFIAGPVLGGLLGDVWVRLPFLVAAALHGATLLLAVFVLPASRRATGRRLGLAALSPARPLRFIGAQPSLVPVALVVFVLSAAGEAYGTCWSLWAAASFHWSGALVGLSLGAFGVCQALVQALLPALATRKLGGRGALVAGIACSSLGLVAIAFARDGWIVFAVMPLFALGGLGVPALQARATQLVTPAQQGELQGVLSSVVSLASIAAPLGFSMLYALVQRAWPGAIWLTVVAVQGLAVPLARVGRRRRAREPRS